MRFATPAEADPTTALLLEQEAFDQENPGWDHEVRVGEAVALLRQGVSASRVQILHNADIARDAVQRLLVDEPSTSIL